MDRKFVGYEFKSQDAFDAEMQEALASGDASQLPVRAAPVYADGQGNRWAESPGPEGITRRALPSSSELESTPKRRKAPEVDPRLAMYKGGFVPAANDLQPSGGWSDPASNRPGSSDYVDAAKMPPGVSGGVASPGITNGGWAGGLGGGDEGGLGLDQLMGGMASQLPPEQALAWLGDTAARAMTAAAPGGMLDNTMKALGLTNPMAGGPLGDALGAALKSAGLDGAAGGMLGTLMNRGASGLASQLGSNVVNQALGMAGLGDLPGMGALSGLAGGALGNFAGGAIDDIAGGVVGDLLKNGASGAAASLLGGIGGGAGGLADLMTTGGFAGPLGDATGAFDNIMGGCFPGGDSGMADLSKLTSGGCFDPNAGAGLDLNALGSKGLDKAVDHMMSEWKVDDESSAAEHIAHKMVSENLADLKSLAKDELLGGKGGGLAGLADKIKKFFTGEAPGTGQPAIRMGDLDDQANLCITGIANIKFEGQPVARRTDTVAGPTAPAPKPIVIGEPTVISAGMENAFVLAPTAVPSKMAAKGATTILVGGAVVAALQEAAKKEAEAKANAAPKAPTGPNSTDSGSASEGQEGEGKSPEGEAGSETAGDNDGSGDNTEATSQEGEGAGQGGAETPAEEGGDTEGANQNASEATDEAKQGAGENNGNESDGSQSEGEQTSEATNSGENEQQQSNTDDSDSSADQETSGDKQSVRDKIPGRAVETEAEMETGDGRFKGKAGVGILKTDEGVKQGENGGLIGQVTTTDVGIEGEGGSSKYGAGSKGKAEATFFEASGGGYRGTDPNNPDAEVQVGGSVLKASASGDVLVGHDGKRTGLALGGTAGAHTVEGKVYTERCYDIPFTDLNVCVGTEASASGPSVGVGAGGHAYYDHEEGRVHVGGHGTIKPILGGLGLKGDISIGRPYENRERPIK